MINEYLITRMQMIQKELEELQRVAKRQLQEPKRKVKLRGIWHGVRVSEEELHEAKQAIFKDAYTFDL